jgi:hypothetical protein
MLASLNGVSAAASIERPVAFHLMDSDFNLSSHRGRSPPSHTTGDAGTSRDLNGKLIEPSSPHSRSSRLPTLPPSTTTLLNTPPESAISAPIEYTYNTTRQDVPHGFVNSSATYSSTTSSIGPRNAYPHSSPLERPLSSFTSSDSPQDDSLNHHSTRPLTSTQVFPRLPDLAAHYGIPQLLPPAPRPIPRRPSLASPSTSNQPESFAQVCSNYLNMLSQSPADNTMSEDTSPIMDSADLFPSSVSAEEAAQSLYEVLSASPEFNTSPEFPMSEFLTSPWDDSPLDDMLTTPALDPTDLDMFTSPLLTDTGEMSDMNLFGGLFEPLSISKPLIPPPLPLENMYTMPSPVTPSLDPTSLYASPRLPSTPFPSHSAQPMTRRKSTATGTRKNLTPESLVPLDAPTQPRKYSAPSATSRKELPAVFAKKRARSQALGDDEDMLPEEPLPPNATEKEQIEWKRRQNTLAARKSRKRKLQHQLELENAVERLTVEKETWRVRALTYQALLRNHGHDVPEFS